MLNKLDICEKINKLKEKLNSSIEDENLCDEKILHLSREVDELVLEFYSQEDKLKNLFYEQIKQPEI